MPLLLLLLLLLVAGRVDVATSAELTAFSCDTPGVGPLNTTSHTNFYTAVQIAFLGGGGCPYPGPTAAALGPCFLSPAAAKAALDLLPAGKRALSLEGDSLYSVQDATRTPVIQDKLLDGASCRPLPIGYLPLPRARLATHGLAGAHTTRAGVSCNLNPAHAASPHRYTYRLVTPPTPAGSCVIQALSRRG